jgi:CD109 antigen
VETKDSDTIVIVYFDDIDTTEICPDFKAYRTHGVAKQKPSPIIVYDYYDNCKYFVDLKSFELIYFLN